MIGDVAGLWGFNCRQWRGLLEDVEVDRSGVLPGPVVMFAFGLYDVAVWDGSLVSDGPEDVLILCWGQEQHFMAQV